MAFIHFKHNEVPKQDNAVKEIVTEKDMSNPNDLTHGRQRAGLFAIIFNSKTRFLLKVYVHKMNRFLYCSETSLATYSLFLWPKGNISN